MADCIDCLRLLRPCNWADEFRARKAGFQTVLIPLPRDFVEYLNADGLILPKAPDSAALSSQDPRFRLPAAETPASADDSDDDDEAYCFPDLEKAISAAIEEVGGAAFAKFEWSAPLDASWIALGGSIKVESPGQLYSLLKASEIVGSSMQAVTTLLNHSGTESTPALSSSPVLAIKPWYHLHETREFRCVFQNRKPIAVCRRHITAGPWPYNAAETDEIKVQVSTFLTEKVMPFSPVSSGTCDFYLDKKGRGWVLDFGLLREQGDLLCFSLEELGIASTAEVSAASAPLLCGHSTVPELEASATDVAILWRFRKSDVSDSIEEEGTTADPSAAAAAGAGAGISFPKAAANKYPDELLQLCAATGKSVSEVLEDMESAFAAAGMGMFQGAGDDDDSDDTDEVEEQEGGEDKVSTDDSKAGLK